MFGDPEEPERELENTFAELSAEETAEALGIEVPIVKTRLFPARRRLREDLG